MAMIPALQYDYWGSASLVLAAPVVVWAGWPFHKAAWTNLKHGAATMDTLISVGTIAALIWSIIALFFGTAGQDRKSTRLNSSHVAISYAVFCLKKKKGRAREEQPQRVSVHDM